MLDRLQIARQQERGSFAFPLQEALRAVHRRQIFARKSMIQRGRLTATLEGDFVVFLIGMRINRLWKLNRWLPLARAMPRMLAELEARPDMGMLGGEMWFGRTTILVQYWRTLEQLLAYATNREAEHLPAWRHFNQSIATSGDVGVWHETYAVAPGAYENIYVNMPPFGLGKVGRLGPATGALGTAYGRIKAQGERARPEPP